MNNSNDLIKDDYSKEEVTFVNKFLRRLIEIEKPASREDLIFDGSGCRNMVNSTEYNYYYHILSENFFVKEDNGFFFIEDEGRKVIEKGGFRKYITYLKQEQRKKDLIQQANGLLGESLIVKTNDIPKKDKVFIFSKILSGNNGSLHLENNFDVKIKLPLYQIVQYISIERPLFEPIDKPQPRWRATKRDKTYLPISKK